MVQMAKREVDSITIGKLHLINGEKSWISLSIGTTGTNGKSTQSICYHCYENEWNKITVFIKNTLAKFPL